MKSTFVYGGIGVSLVLSVLALFQTPQAIEKVQSFGAFPGTFITEYLELAGGFEYGGCVTATSSIAAHTTLQSGEFSKCSVIEFQQLGASTVDHVLTLAASTSAAYPRKPGGIRTIYVRNATTSATTDLFFKAGTGINLKVSTSTLGAGNATSTIAADTDGEGMAR